MARPVRGLIYATQFQMLYDKACVFKKVHLNHKMDAYPTGAMYRFAR